MLVLRRILCTAWGQGIHSSPGSVRLLERLDVKEKAAWGTRTCLIHAVRNYASIRRKDVIPSQLDDLPTTMLKKEYTGVPLSETVDDVVKRLLTLEMASQAEKLKIKTQQLVDKVKRDPHDTNSEEVKIAAMTATIRNLHEHIQKHPKDKANKRRMLMAMDQRKKKLKFLRNTRFDAFEHVCTQLGIEYTFPPEYYRRVTRRWLVKKALCLKVYEEVKKLRAAGLLRNKRPTQTKPHEKPKETQGTPV
ncbi:28S ribosomal protein S15, mitochondrial [Bombina bombina]|uniref:28S ribosomal protein S15, mitochondrial n=1 Tax=Bombina bombina TaxID=8345 RepID=UPI00235A4FAB|nr:28S ribosomal protein S15, mitochondrial [Bombina bombina]